MEWPRLSRAFSSERKRARGSGGTWEGRRASLYDVGSPLEVQAAAEGAEARFRAQQEHVYALEEALAEAEKEKEEHGRVMEMEREKAEDWKKSAEVLREAEEKLREELLQARKKARRDLDELQERIRKDKGKLESTERRVSEVESEKMELQEKAVDMEKKWVEKCHDLERQVDQHHRAVLDKDEELQKVRRELRRMQETSNYSEQERRETVVESKDDLESTKKQLEDALLSAAEERNKAAMLKRELDELAASRSQEGDSLMIKNLLKEIESLTKELIPLRKMKDKLESNVLLQEKLHAAVERADRAERVLESYGDLEGELHQANQALRDWRNFTEENPRIKCAQDLKDLLDSHEKERITLQSELEENKESIASLSAEIRNLGEAKQKAEDEAEKIRRDYNDAVASALRSERKALLLAKERDSLQSILNSYQEELTVHADTEHEVQSPVNYTLATQRMYEAERSLKEKESLLQTYESEISDLKSCLSAQRQRLELLDGEKGESDKYISKLERENEGLCEEIEKMVRRLGRGEFNPDTTKVVHVTRNPELKARLSLLETNLASTQRENSALKAQLINLGKGDEAEGVQLDKSAHMEQPKHETAVAALFEAERTVLQHRVTELEKRETRYKEAFKDCISTFREACYLLFGYRVDMGVRPPEEGSDHGPVNTFCIRSMYAERDADELKFEQQSDGCLALVPTPYSDTLQREIDTFVTRFGSLPALLANLTMESFNRHTTTL